MTSKEALKRLWQETCPATYMKDFNKKECCDAIERDLEKLAQALKILDIFKRKLVIEIGKDLVNLKEDKEQKYDYTCIIVNQQERELLKEWLENDNK